MHATRRIAVIINPISGTGGRPDAARRRTEQAASLLASHGVEAEIFVTERGRHGHDLATAAIRNGVSLVVAWGGDGTVNEVASALAFSSASLAVIPSGSGNGLARELAIPLEPAAAFACAVTGRTRVIDCGELDGRLFFNVAGLGLDARVAHEFAAHGLVRRGFSRYIEVAARELFTYQPNEHTIIADGELLRSRALIVALANARQYGNGALIAPNARIDDGKLDVVVVDARPVWQTLLQVPKLFSGRIAAAPGVTMRAAATIELTSSHPVVYHIDGEPFVGGASLTARAHAQALHVQVPSSGPAVW
jgi:YegS/Rv2252/BmrU family lipid kinase